MSPEDWAALVRIWFPEVADPRLRQATRFEIARYHAHIEAMSGQMTVATIWRRLHDEHGLTCSEASFRRYMRTIPTEKMDSR
jgi:hypothetical protein